MAGHKEVVASAFTDLVSDPKVDVEARLAEIRGRLEPEYGEGFSFYSEPAVSRWPQGPSSQWDAFIHWARRFNDAPWFDSEERDYKITIGRNVADARRAVQELRGDWLDMLRRAFGPSNNLVNHITWNQLLDWCRAHQVEAREALRRLWAEGDETERVQAFAETLAGAGLFQADLLDGPGLSLIDAPLAGHPGAADHQPSGAVSNRAV